MNEEKKTPDAHFEVWMNLPPTDKVGGKLGGESAWRQLYDSARAPLAASVRELREEVASRETSWANSIDAAHVLGVTLANLDALMAEHGIEK